MLAALSTLLFLFSSTVADYPGPGYVTGDVSVHDPSMIKFGDTYYLFSTGPNIEIRTSKDRINFQKIGAVWPNGASWTYEFTNNGDSLWAPDISYHGGKFILYYAASTFGSRKSAIFLATSPTGLPGSWTHQGVVVQTDDSSDHNAIDPNLIVDPSGNWWLTYGSFWTGIKLIQIDPGTGKPANSNRYSIANRPSGEHSVEAAYIIYREGFYYLFVSFDHCCQGTNSNYRTMVGRSKSVTGPYVDRNGLDMMNSGGTEVVASHGSVIGPGHVAVMSDADGWLLIYHYYVPGNNLLGINLIDWSDGWPRIY